MKTNPTLDQLKRAVQIHEEIERLQSELSGILGEEGLASEKLVTITELVEVEADAETEPEEDEEAPAPKRRGRPPGSGRKPKAPAPAKKKGGMSEEGRARIVEAQKRRWAAFGKKKGK